MRTKEERFARRVARIARRDAPVKKSRRALYAEEGIKTPHAEIRRGVRGLLKALQELPNGDK